MSQPTIVGLDTETSGLENHHSVLSVALVTLEFDFFNDLNWWCGQDFGGQWGKVLPLGYNVGSLLASPH